MSMRILEGIRRACGEDFIVGMSVSTSDSYPVLHGIEALCEIVARHDATGHLDYVTCGPGGYLDLENLMPTFAVGEKPTVNACAELMRAVSHAKVQAESGIRTPENAKGVLSAGEANLVSIVRGQSAGPHWARKVSEGRAENIRGCISCNQMCWGRRSRDYWISCLVNPSVGREHAWVGDRFERAQAPRQAPYAFYGGRVAGMEI